MLALQLAQADVLEDGRPNERSVKQGASLLFKNFVRANWKGVSTVLTIRLSSW